MEVLEFEKENELKAESNYEQDLQIDLIQANTDQKNSKEGEVLTRSQTESTNCKAFGISPIQVPHELLKEVSSSDLNISIVDRNPENGKENKTGGNKENNHLGLPRINIQQDGVDQEIPNENINSISPSKKPALMSACS